MLAPSWKDHISAALSEHSRTDTRAVLIPDSTPSIRLGMSTMILYKTAGIRNYRQIFTLTTYACQIVIRWFLASKLNRIDLMVVMMYLQYVLTNGGVLLGIGFVNDGSDEAHECQGGPFVRMKITM